MYVVSNVRMEQQVRNLNCGRYCLEALMAWRHGTKYGRKTANQARKIKVKRKGSNKDTNYMSYGQLRTSHSPDVQAHIDDIFACGFKAGLHMNDYGLTDLLPTPQAASDWEAELREYGPLLVGGRIGAVEVIPMRGAQHDVLVIGIDDRSDEILYLDPLGKVVGGGLAFFGVKGRDANTMRRMSRTSFLSKVTGRVMASCPVLTTTVQPGSKWLPGVKRPLPVSS